MVFSTYTAKTTGYSYAPSPVFISMSFRHSPFILHKIDKCKMQNLKFLEENVCDFGSDDEFLDIAWKSQYLKEKSGKLDFIKI